MTADRELLLRCVPYNQPTHTVDLDGTLIREVFRRGSFLGAQPRKVDLLVRHNGAPVGSVLGLTEDGHGLRARVLLDRTMRGTTALAEVRSGALGGVSVGFVPWLHRQIRDEDGPLLERRLVRLRELSLVPDPAYEGTTVRTRTQVEQERVREWLWLNQQRRAAGLDPRPLPVRPRSVTAPEQPAAPPREPQRAAGASAGGGLRYSAPTGRVLGVS